MIQMVVNGEKVILEHAMTLATFIEKRGINPLSIVMEHNGVVVKKEQWASIECCENDTLEILAFMGGGSK
jgi:thiamine biosynthesis protein ThiS